MKHAVYRAPALEKGLEVLELLAGQAKPVGLTKIAQELGRTATEIYRVLQVLEARRYIERSPDGGHFQITERVFQLGMLNSAKLNLQIAATPVMTRLAEQCFQSCHLYVLTSDDAALVVARAEGSGAVSFVVHLGYRVPLLDSTSGRVIFAFQTPQRQAAWLSRLRSAHADPVELRKFTKEAKEVAERGHALAASRITLGIKDIAAPVFGPGPETAIASLVMPFVTNSLSPMGLEDCIPLVVEAADEISHGLSGQ